MPNHNAIHEMLSMQNTLNEMTNGENWRSGLTQLGKVIDWRRCIYMETAELIDSYPWKHWKSVEAKTDIENVQVELVDIWHFLLSLALEHFDLEESAGLLEKAMQVSQKSQESKKTDNESSVIDQVAIHEEMMRLALQKSEVSQAYLTALASAFFNSCQVAALSFEQLYQIYMAKNVLNKFRQDHGYKEGTYSKLWNGREDNVVMFEIIAKMSVFSGDELYLSLKQYYSQVG
ncbi:MAG: dUTP diphosphatase [Thiomicrorhabdus chilensis]|uniref:dUTP diphosphatase n=1 Tax=Thiomicrorhabdus chilensis TaxID=63656 RepID=UPI0003F98B35|nr:dUTP diphosphatase [Thiomicrorhabdus chilensis]MDX1348116.1 dUTP diphosphatase [Thiomicrorhabdus chilensis]